MNYLAQAGDQQPLLPNLTELIIGAISFFIVFGALAKLLLPRIQKTLEDRTNAIEGGLQRAEEAQAKANELLEQYRAQLADARHEAARLREEARQQGAQIIAEVRSPWSSPAGSSASRWRMRPGSAGPWTGSWLSSRSSPRAPRSRRRPDEAFRWPGPSDEGDNPMRGAAR
jgi:hypothetical protein